MFFDRLLAFDHLRHQIHIIATADVSRESPRQPMTEPITDIAVLEKKLAAACARPPGRRPAAGEGQAQSPRRHQPRTFHRAVESAKEYIAAGDIFQVVLSQRLDFVPASGAL